MSAHTRPAILIRRKLCDERPMRIRVVRPLVGLPRLVDADRLPGAGNVNANTSKIRYVFFDGGIISKIAAAVPVTLAKKKNLSASLHGQVQWS